MFDPASKRIYATSGGAGVINVFKETDPDHYQSLGQVPSGPGGKTGLLVPQMMRLFVPVPAQGTHAAPSSSTSSSKAISPRTSWTSGASRR